MNIEEVKETFEFMDEWEDRYRFIIDLGRKLPDFDEADQTEENRVHGCTSKVWLVYNREGDKVIFKGDSDAHIVKGLVALILMIYSGKTPEEIRKQFNIENDFTPEEYEQARKENEWCEER